MALFSMHWSWVFIFGILGNIISFMVFLAPIPTFYRIVKKKSSQGYQSIPYLVALFSSMLWIYYALLKSNVILMITINSVGCVIEITYIALYIAYASRKDKMLTLKILILFNFGGFSLIALCSYYLTKGSNRLQLIGWISLAINISVFVSPLSILKKVICTRSVEFMPFSLSFFLTLNAIVWFFYGLLQKDFYIYLPNTLGFVFGVIQMVLYLVYKDCNKVPENQMKLPTVVEQDTTTRALDQVHPEFSLQNWDESRERRDQNVQNQIARCEEYRAHASNQV